MARRVLFFGLLGLLVLLINKGPAEAAPAEAANANETQNTRISPDTRIVGGEDAKEGQFPWQAALLIDNSFFCGGSIIDAKWILTAGHCTFGGIVFEVTVGTIYSGTPPPTAVEPDRATITSLVGIPHPFYIPNPIEDDNDVGLVMLPKALVFSANVKVIPLATLDPDYLNLDGHTCRISGWGKTSDIGSVSPVLKYTDLTVVASAVCATAYRDMRMDQKICCSTLDMHSTCNGDSGGPLIYRGEDGQLHQVGIVSYGSTSCTKGIPVVFARVTSFLNFINVVTGLNK